MMLVRHGFMIVGDPIGGKTSAWKVLAAALSELGREENSDEVPVCYKGRYFNALFFCFHSLYFPISCEYNQCFHGYRKVIKS